MFSSRVQNPASGRVWGHRVFGYPDKIIVPKQIIKMATDFFILGVFKLSFFTVNFFIMSSRILALKLKFKADIGDNAPHVLGKILIFVRIPKPVELVGMVENIPYSDVSDEARFVVIKSPFGPNR